MRTNINTQNITTLINTHLLRSTLDRALFKKGVLADNITISNQLNKTLIIIKGFTRTDRITKYRRIIRKKSYVKKKAKTNLINTLLSKLNKKDGSTNLVIKYRNINKRINTRKVRILYTSLKHFIPSLFKRGYNLFLDFTKLTSLFIYRRVNLRSYLRILGIIFKNITKRQHSKYMLFMKTLFSVIIKNSDERVKGLKMIINGKIMGKTRANSAKISHGTSSKSSVIANTVVESIHVFTIYGVFGLQLSVSTLKTEKSKRVLAKNRLKKRLAVKKK